jgi:hypothetical protein
MENVELKNKWIAARNTNAVSVDLIIEYAIHRGITLPTSKVIFGLQFCDNAMLIESVDNYLGVHILEDKDGNFIKIVQ